VCTLLVRKIALRFAIIDVPDGDRKLHATQTPLLGGVALYLAFWSVVGYVARYTELLTPHITHRQLWGIFLATTIIIILGIIDDRQSVSPWTRIVVTALATVIAIASGIGLAEISNPFGGVWNLHFWNISLGVLGSVSLAGGLVVFMWLMGMMYTTKILDGLDGLSAGITGVGFLMIYLLTHTKKFFQPDVGLLALIALGAIVGFLLFNFHPAKIFLGESGSLFIGFILGILAIISGGKIATALLVMAVPILDLLRVMYVRFNHRQPLFKGDREHLHFRLRDAGFSERTTVLFLYLVMLRRASHNF
jgi:UDP-GlcNAc:undecaprenyl-phosphate GlcNAc-1-phosphate transferase